MQPVIRPALPADVPALVTLRLANAQWHVSLDPDVYRVPDAAIVRAHFERSFPEGRFLLAEIAGEIAGSAEIVPLPDPPAEATALTQGIEICTRASSRTTQTPCGSIHPRVSRRAAPC
ncbi:hypothetical protein GCM10010435_72650 [Winogradskya consettensis]|uniref:Acetyltransferase n=1 Tax=Winogradskya consettensis TaxID=113560 RepID=A0A919W6J3_9ACTN|nr:hypothetical protein [Actinoplanes consettensis]GIM83634.1 hypothetical protein Aco04nite_87540 [Actinoplanes consettensis]